MLFTDHRLSLLCTVVFGSSWLLTSGTAAAVVKGGMQDLDIATVAEEQASFVVLYSDISNKGAMTATMGQVSRHTMYACLYYVYRCISVYLSVSAYIHIHIYQFTN